ncbi:uncharacterized protein LOC114733244 [Neltuma alba]|uniref:uncharacterized protein LOC114723882 n=1 Tax=Neltuma alba TaxID=207710 RepID=UPI0010A52C60|nr:uncharacterized protein LOC114723882 [Prosopis alba]XP_028776500.1 uncharacterized protein LOC114733244 [Prosopis alba]
MSDIAMLVAEEYERRVSILRKAGVDGVGVSQERIDEGASVLAQRLMKHKREVLQWAWEPKSQVGVAASASFFSA